MSEKLQILFVTPRYLPDSGGTEIHVHEVGWRLVNAGHRVVVLTVDPRRELRPREEQNGIEVVRLPAWPKNRDYYFCPSLIGHVRRSGADIVHCQGYHTFVAPIAMLAARTSDIPYVVSFHSGGHSSFLRQRARRVQVVALRPLFSRAARLIAMTNFEKRQFQSMLGLPDSAFAIVPSGGDLTDLGALPAPDVDPNLIVSLGRVERYKGHDKVITALPHVIHARPNIELRVFGTGPFVHELRRLSERLGVDDRVKIEDVPFAHRDEFVRAVRSAALVISLSEYESLGLGALEVAFLGRPLLVSNSSALRELVEAGIARGVSQSASSEVIAAAILDQLERPHLPPRVHLPTWAECVNRLEEIYSSIVHERRGATAATATARH